MGGCKKQLAQIIAKDLNCALGGGIGQLAAQLVFKAGMNEAAVGVAGGGIHKLGAFAAGLLRANIQLTMPAAPRRRPES